MDTDRITIQLPRDAAAAVVHVLDRYIQRDSGTGYGSILRSLQTTIIQDGFGGVRPDPTRGLASPRAGGIVHAGYPRAVTASAAVSEAGLRRAALAELGAA
jgi:hypothetical protein